MGKKKPRKLNRFKQCRNQEGSGELAVTILLNLLMNGVIFRTGSEVETGVPGQGMAPTGPGQGGMGFWGGIAPCEGGEALE